MRRTSIAPREAMLVALGGGVGTALREACGSLLPGTLGDISLATITVNLSGCLLLGFLLETLARRGTDHGRRRLLRLTLGTGVLGGYTTYSGLAVQMATQLHRGSPLMPFAGSLLTVVGGLLLALVGVRLAAPTEAIALAALQHEPIDPDSASEED